MVSTTRINDALNRALNVRYALLGLFVDSTLVGSANRMYRTAKDIFTLYALEKALFNAATYGFDDTEIETLIYKIREFIGALSYVSSVDYSKYKYPTVTCPTISGPFREAGNGSGGTSESTTTEIYTTDSSEWYSQNLTSFITDGITQFSGINFSIDDSSIDFDTILLEVNGDNPLYTTDTNKDGWHMEGNTLYWHNFYDLKAGMQVVIRWRKD